jgi:hypothetical protein
MLTQKEINLINALRFGIIDEFTFFEMWRGA